MEQALEEFRFPFFDGFSGSFRTFFDPHTQWTKPIFRLDGLDYGNYMVPSIGV
jgi:hypothetical protein